ncbi:MAG: hypothetical protein LBS55_13595 [Prevotellaceae bacterium]|jgi:hypothetical protein|nr:hypothetical protein [Prevotellaceae bacterium]
MKKIFFRIRKWTSQFIVHSSSFIVHSSQFIVLSLSFFVYCSCDDNYDNIKDFSVKEKVYPAHFDTIYATPGYQRVEIDLAKDNATGMRVPSRFMKLGKAKKTIVEYDDKSIVFDSVCSWVGIDSLNIPKLYRFYVYTDDGNGNRSVPMEIALTPYTSVDGEALGAPNPELSSFAEFMMVNWPNGLSSDLMDFLHLEYSYKDQNGTLRSGTTRNSQFFVQNTAPDVEVPVSVTYWVYPKLNAERILDSISFTDTLRVRKSLDVTPIEFEVSPSRVALLPGKLRVLVPNIQFGLKWKSDNTNVASVTANGVIRARTPGTAIITVTTEAIEGATATVKVIVPDVSSIPANDKLAGIWTFGDGADLVEPLLGLDLEPFGEQFTQIEGPNGTKAVQISSSSYYGIKHEMSPNGEKVTGVLGETEPVTNSVNEYTLMMDIRIPASDYTAWKTLFNTQPQNVGDGVMWSNNGNIGKVEFGGQSEYKVLKGDTWHRVVFAVKLSDSKFSDVFHVYVDGEHVWEINASEAEDAIKASIAVGGKLSLYTNDILNSADTDSDYLYIGADNRGTGSRKSGPDIAELRLWNTRLTAAQIKALGGF